MVKKVAKKRPPIKSSPRPRTHKLRELGILPEEAALIDDVALSEQTFANRTGDVGAHIRSLRQRIFSTSATFYPDKKEPEKREPDYMDYYHASKGLLNASLEVQRQLEFGKTVDMTPIYSHLALSAVPAAFRPNLMAGLRKGLTALALSLEGTTVRSAEILARVLKNSESLPDDSLHSHSEALAVALSESSQEIATILVASGVIGNSISHELITSRVEYLARTIAARAALTHATIRLE